MLGLFERGLELLDLCGLRVDEFGEFLDLVVFGLELLILFGDLGLEVGNQLFGGGLRRAFGGFAFELGEL